MGEQVVAGEDGVYVAAVVGPLHPSFEDPGQHPDRGVGQPLPERARREHVCGEVHSKPSLDLDHPPPLLIG